MKVRLPKPELQSIGTTLAWKVPSSREPDLHYYVLWPLGHDMECTCPGFRFNRKCWHVEEVENMPVDRLIKDMNA